MGPKQGKGNGSKRTEKPIPDKQKIGNEEETVNKVCDKVTEMHEGGNGSQYEAGSSGAGKKEGESGEQGDESVEKTDNDGMSDTVDRRAVVECDNDERDADKGPTVAQVSEASSGEEEEEKEASSALLPEGMYFPPLEYTKASFNNCKIGTRCSVWKTVEYLQTFPAELKWFTEHEQFKHVFHMPAEPNHQLQGMLMLVLRTARTRSNNEAWFVVNGSPIRYSIREHAILTGFNCKEYPDNWEDLGSPAFVRKVFGEAAFNEEGVKIADVKAKLEAMKHKNSTARRKLAVLYFLSKVLQANNKNAGKVDPFLLRIVDDLSACETFPWGRYTFLGCMAGLRKMLKNMNGATKKGSQPGFSGFIIPLEILPFECIRNLGRKFRADVSADPGCPRMCKRKFVNVSGTKACPLDDLYAALGKSKAIISILESTVEERGLFKRNVEDYVYADDGLGIADPAVVTWHDVLLVKREKVFWKSLYDEDVGARLASSEHPSSSTMMMLEAGIEEKSVENLESIKAELLQALDKGMGKCLAAIVDLENKIGDLEIILKGSQHYVAVYSPPGDSSVVNEVAKQLMEMGKLNEQEEDEEGEERVDNKKLEEAEEEKKEKAEEDKGIDGGADDLGKRKNGKESDADDEEKNRRRKIQRLKKHLGDV